MIYESEWYRGKKQEGPLRKTSRDDRRDLATVADGAVNFALFGVLDSELLSFRSDCDSGDDRLCLVAALLSSLRAWSTLLRAALLGGRILRDDCIEP